MNKIRLYIMPNEDGNTGNGVYYLISEKGECLASHLCSHIGYAKGDLEADRPERQKEWKKKFGDYEVLTLGDDEMTAEELLRLNKEFHKKEIQKIKS